MQVLSTFNCISIIHEMPSFFYKNISRIAAIVRNKKLVYVFKYNIYDKFCNRNLSE